MHLESNADTYLLLKAIYNNAKDNPNRADIVLQNIAQLIEKFAPEVIPAETQERH